MNRKQLTIALLEENFKAADQFLNTFLLGILMWCWHMIVGAGRPSYADETVSARTHRAYKNGKILGRVFRPLIDALFFWQSKEYTLPDGSIVQIDSHCERAYMKERDKRGLPTEYADTPQAA